MVPGTPNTGPLLKNGRTHGSMLTRDFFVVGTGPQGAAVVVGAAGAVLLGEPVDPSWARAAFPMRSTPTQTPSFSAFIVIKPAMNWANTAMSSLQNRTNRKHQVNTVARCVQIPGSPGKNPGDALANLNADVISSAEQEGICSYRVVYTGGLCSPPMET